jgi:membrane protease YdiL (CAAX protease family)
MSATSDEPGRALGPSAAAVPDAALVAAAAARPCAYCGAALDARWYFCARCASPWTDPDRVVRPVPPEEKTTERLVRERAPVVWTIVWTYACVILFGSIAVWLAFGDERPDVATVVLDAAILVVTCAFAVVHWASLAPQLRRVGFDRLEGWLVLAAVAPLLLVNWGWHSLLEAAGFETGGVVEGLREHGLSEAAVLVVMAVVPAVAEEVAFRGLVQHWLTVAVGARKAIFLGAVLFAALHFSVASFPYLLLAGLVLGWAKERTGSLYPSMVAHFVHNAAVVAFFPD